MRQITCIFLGALLGLFCCRGKTHVNSRSSEPTTGEPVEISDSINSDRTYFQTRNPIVLNLSSSLLSKGESFTLSNESTNETLINQEIASQELRTNSLYVIEQSDPFLKWEISIRFFPLDEDLEGKFSYGENVFKVDVNDGLSGKTGKYSITRKDFSLFAPSASRFNDAVARISGLEIMPTAQAKSVLRNGKHTLTIDTINMMSR